MALKKFFHSAITLMFISIHGLKADEVRFFDNERVSSHLLTSLCQDNDGYIWVGTEYGLNRFDGMVFTHYFTYNSTLTDNSINDLFVDESGDLYVISGKTLQIYDSRTGVFDKVSFPEGHVPVLSDVAQMHDGTVVVSNSRQGLWTVDKSSMTAIPMDEVNSSIGATEIHTLFVDGKDRLWICTNTEGLYVYERSVGVRKALPPMGVPEQKVATGITETDDGVIYVLGKDALFMINDETLDLEQIFAFDYSYSVRRLYRSSDGVMYAGSYGNGLYVVDLANGRLVQGHAGYQKRHGLDGCGMYAFLEDAEGNFWFGFNTKGLMFLSRHDPPFSYRSLDEASSSGSDFLTSVHPLPDGRILAGQAKEGLHLLDKDMKYVRTYMKGCSPLAVSPISGNRVWVGDYARGAGILDLNTGKVKWVLEDKRVSDFTFDEDGNIYMAIFDGRLTSFTPDGSTRRALGRETGGLKMYGRYLNTLLTDSQGLIWVGHHYGFDVYDPSADSLIPIAMGEELRKAIVYDMMEASDGVVWLATSRGLFGYDRMKQEWEHKNVGNGLMGEMVCSVLEAADSTLWLSTYRGLIHYVRGEERFSYYLKGNGLQEISYTRGVACATPDGCLHFGNDLGFTSFLPERVVSDAFAKPLKAVTLIMDGKSVDVGDKVVLPHDKGAFTMRFSAMDYRNPENLSFEYMLSDSKEDGWRRTPMGYSEVDFLNLGYGDHTLYVRALYNEARSEIREVVIRICPPWYLSALAKMLYVIIVLVFLSLLWLYWKHRKQAEMNEEKIRFFIDVSHEIRSPLTLIKSPLETLLMMRHDEKTKRALDSISRNADRLLLLVDQILSIRRMERGAFKMKFAQTSVWPLVREICADYDFVASRRGISFSLSAEDESLSAWVDNKGFQKIVGNLVSNAFKYVADGGSVEVSLSQVTEPQAKGPMKDVVRLVVRDNGEGIDEKELKHIFDRFYQVGSGASGRTVGYGIGLNLTAQLVRMHGGTINARNRRDVRGAEFEVRIPVGNAHLPADSLVAAEEKAARQVQEREDGAEFELALQRSRRRRTNDRIIVVDDDRELTDYLVEEMGTIYHVSAYSDGMMALQAISESVPHLVIADVSMPGMDGFALLHRLKNNTTTSHIPVILLTTKVEHEARMEGFSQGADAYVDKPFNIDELIALAGSLIANRARMRGKMNGMQEQDGVVKPVEMKGNDQQLMERVMKVVNARLCDSDFNVETLAEEVGLSRVQLHRRIKDITGITVGEFLRNLRLKQAAELLAKGDVTISQVTYALGMSNPTHFTAAFKRYYGMTPTEYMKKHAGVTNK